MKNLANTRIVFSPIRIHLWNWRNWWPLAAVFLSAGFTAFAIWCAAKAVR